VPLKRDNRTCMAGLPPPCLLFAGRSWKPTSSPPPGSHVVQAAVWPAGAWHRGSPSVGHHVTRRQATTGLPPRPHSLRGRFGAHWIEELALAAARNPVPAAAPASRRGVEHGGLAEGTRPSLLNGGFRAAPAPRSGPAPIRSRLSSLVLTRKRSAYRQIRANVGDIFVHASDLMG